MSELMNIRDQYFNGAENLHNISKQILTKNSNKISRKQLNEFKDKLSASYTVLLSIDRKFSTQLPVKNRTSDSHWDTSDEEFVLIHRSFYISNLEKLEKEIMNIENAKQFRLTIKIALVAIIVSTFISALSILLSTNIG